MNDFKRQKKNYLKRIKQDLLFNTKHSKQFIKDFSISVNDYIEENEIAEFAEVQSHFGTPEEIESRFW